MPARAVDRRLRSACVLLDEAEEHAEAIAAWFADNAEADTPIAPEEAIRNVRELLQGYSEGLVARARVLHALTELRPAGAECRSLQAELAVRQALGALREQLTRGLGILALEQAQLEHRLRDPEALLERAEHADLRLRRFFENRKPRHGSAWPHAAVDAVTEATAELRRSLEARPPAGALALGLARAASDFDEAFDDAQDLLQSMLSLADLDEAAQRVEAAWAWPGCIADEAAQAAIGTGSLTRLLGEPASTPPASAIVPQPPLPDRA